MQTLPLFLQREACWCRQPARREVSPLVTLRLCASEVAVCLPAVVKSLPTHDPYPQYLHPRYRVSLLQVIRDIRLATSFARLPCRSCQDKARQSIKTSRIARVSLVPGQNSAVNETSPPLPALSLVLGHSSAVNDAHKTQEVCY